MNTLPFDVLWHTTEYFDIETLNAFGRVSTESIKMLAQPKYDGVWLKTFENYSSTWDGLSKLNSLAGLMNIRKIYRQGEDPVVKAFRALPMLVAQSSNRLDLEIKASKRVALVYTEENKILCDATMSSEITLQGFVDISESGEWLMQTSFIRGELSLTRLNGTQRMGKTVQWSMDKAVENIYFVGNYVAMHRYPSDEARIMTFYDPNTQAIIKTHSHQGSYPMRFCTDDYMVMTDDNFIWLEDWHSDKILSPKHTWRRDARWVRVFSKLMFYSTEQAVFKISMMDDATIPPVQVLVVPQDQGPCFSIPNAREDVLMTYTSTGVQIYHQGGLVRTVACFLNRFMPIACTNTHLYIQCGKFQFDTAIPPQERNAKNFGVMRIPMD